MYNYTFLTLYSQLFGNSEDEEALEPDNSTAMGKYRDIKRRVVFYILMWI